MRAVLYTEDMMPITVLDLRGIPDDLIWEERRFRLAVNYEPLCYHPGLGGTFPTFQIKNVEIWVEVLVRNGFEYPIFFTNDEETALLLKADILPGQQKEIQKENQKKFREGFVLGLVHALGGRYG